MKITTQMDGDDTKYIRDISIKSKISFLKILNFILKGKQNKQDEFMNDSGFGSPSS